MNTFRKSLALVLVLGLTVLGNHSALAKTADTNATANADTVLNDPKNQKATWTGGDEDLPEPLYQGHPLSKILRNPISSGTNEPSLDELLTLRQVITGREPQQITYQVPISYDVVKRFPFDMNLALFSPENPVTEPVNCKRASNGDCLLVWNADFDPPGQYAMQSLLFVSTGWDTPTTGTRTLIVRGPVKPFFSSNLCRFFNEFVPYDDSGAVIVANLAESNGVYKIEIKTPSGWRLKTIKGSTTNGMIQANWDLFDDHDRKYIGKEFVSWFHITLPASGRSQVLKQWQYKLTGRQP